MQGTTVYKKPDGYEPKLNTLKVAAVKKVNGVDKIKTIGRHEIDLTEFCPLGLGGGEREIAIPLHGDGKHSLLRAFVGATFLKDADPGDDHSECMSCMTSPISMDGDSGFDDMREQVRGVAYKGWGSVVGLRGVDAQSARIAQ